MFKKWLRENHLLLENNNWNSVPKRAQVLFAAECANKALHVYEQEFPNDNQPRKAVEAAFEYGLTGQKVGKNIIDHVWNAVRGANDANFAIINAAYAAYYCAVYITINSINSASRATGLNFEPLKEKVIGKTEFDSSWKTTHTLGIAKKIWETRQLGNLPILADALEEAGVDTDLVNYMRNDNENTLADFFLWNLNL